MKKKPLALYVHIPFCVKKCAYCDFLSAPASETEKERYVNLLCEEIEKKAVRYPDYRGTTVFFGGGTPTTLKADQLKKILCKLKERFYIDQHDTAQNERVKEAGKGRETRGKAGVPEITLECNPGTVTKEDLRKLQAAGFNRLSIGLQSAQNVELKQLGRIHTWEDFLETYTFAREAGFENINVDMMSALPGQNVKSYVNTLEQVTALRPEHISAYSLMIEEGTPFYERYGEADEERRKDGEDKAHLLPTEEEERRMYELTEKILERESYHRYEISNYALPGFECRHNIVYWRRGEYLGFGLGAASLMGNCRFTNCREMKAYEEQLKGECAARASETKTDETVGVHKEYGEKTDYDVQHLSVSDQMEEFMFLGLRLTEGISAEKFEECFHVTIEEVYGEIIMKLQRQGLLARSGDRIFLTKRGLDVSNMVFAEFLL